MGLYGLAARVGRRRKPDPPVVVTVVVADGTALQLSPESAIARAMGQVASLLAHW